MKANICTICKGEVEGRLTAHNLCVARNAIGAPIQQLGNADSRNECKVVFGQLFEKINGRWVKTMDTVIFR